MTRLPNAEHAILDIRKLEDYCPSSHHPRGRHKAKVFRDALEISRSDAAWLRQTLLTLVPSQEAIKLAEDKFGHRWRVDVPVRRHGLAAMVRTAWLLPLGDGAPRFVTCWVL